MFADQPEIPAGKDDKNSPPCQRDRPHSGTENHYEIKVAGHLDEHWTEWLGDFRISHDLQGNTRICGAIPDQAALHGLLVQIRDLGLPLIALNRLDGETDGLEE